jgi:hypothetical protein
VEKLSTTGNGSYPQLSAQQDFVFKSVVSLKEIFSKISGVRNNTGI